MLPSKKRIVSTRWAVEIIFAVHQSLFYFRRNEHSTQWQGAWNKYVYLYVL